MTSLRNIAVVGGGMAGLACAWTLSHRYAVTLFEANDYVGGHTNTVGVTTAAGEIPVDTGFIVFNERNYPNLVRLFDWLQVASRASDMSFAVSAEDGRYEYAGSTLASLFVQRRQLVNPAHWRMLADIVRFNTYAKRALLQTPDHEITLEEFLAAGGFGGAFRHYYLLPMAAAIWSCPMQAMLGFPAHSFLAFFLNHGLLDLVGRPRWRTVCGGSLTYVERMLRRLRGRIRLNTPVTAVTRTDAGVRLNAGAECEHFDAVVLAAHADQALRTLAAPRREEREVLGAFHYQTNHAVLHSDPELMPRLPQAWCAWNHLSGRGEDPDAVFVSYWLNRLQGLRTERQFFVTLNSPRRPAARHRIAEFEYAHPVFDLAAARAQARLSQIQGNDNVWFCGSYFGHGFHEDALTSALAVAERLGVPAPWRRGAQPITRHVSPALA